VTQTYTFAVSRKWLSGSFNAVCLIDGMYVKTVDGVPSGIPRKRACLAIDESDIGVVITPIPTSDPRVAGYLHDLWNNPIVPFCGSCF
jgi:hypothetical protein